MKFLTCWKISDSPPPPLHFFVLSFVPWHNAKANLLPHFALRIIDSPTFSSSVTSFVNRPSLQTDEVQIQMTGYVANAISFFQQPMSHHLILVAIWCPLSSFYCSISWYLSSVWGLSTFPCCRFLKGHAPTPPLNTSVDEIHQGWCSYRGHQLTVFQWKRLVEITSIELGESRLYMCVLWPPFELIG